MLYILYALTVLAFIFVLATLVMGAKNMGGKDAGARGALEYLDAPPRHGAGGGHRPFNVHALYQE